jgi:hypothetical protein
MVNLGSIATRSPQEATRFLTKLKANPVLAQALHDVDAENLNRDPSLHIDPVFTDPAVCAAFIAAVDDLVKPTSDATS